MDSGRLPLRGDADDRAAMDAAIEDELRRFELRERTGHPELLKVRVRRLRADLQRLLAREAEAPIEPGCVPARFEHRFGPLALDAADAADGQNGGMALHIEGIIDRVDLGPSRAVVLDYKAGRLLRYEGLLRSQLLQTSFQLPLYAAALTVDKSLCDDGLPPTEVSARYYSLRQGRTSQPLHNAETISLDPGGAPPRPRQQRRRSRLPPVAPPARRRLPGRPAHLRGLRPGSHLPHLRGPARAGAAGVLR